MKNIYSTIRAKSLLAQLHALLTKTTINLSHFFTSLTGSIVRSFAGRTTESSKESERGDVPGWVLVVLMTTGLVTAIWTIASPRLSAILRNSLDSMNGIR